MGKYDKEIEEPDLESNRRAAAVVKEYSEGAVKICAGYGDTIFLRAVHGVYEFMQACESPLPLSPEKTYTLNIKGLKVSLFEE